MSTVAAGLIKLLSSGEKVSHLSQKGAGLIKAAESNPAALARFEETSAAATQEMLKDSYAAVKALVAHALDRDPSDPEVDAVMADAAEHPNAPFRFHRLLGEARKSASRRRRRFLASIFFGLQFREMPDDERDRVDMVVERMVPGDVDLLMRIDQLNRTARPFEKENGRYHFHRTRVTALIDGINVLIATTDDYRSPTAEDRSSGFREEVFSESVFRPDQSAFGSLVALGCIEAAQSQTVQGEWKLHALIITQLGSLVIQSIEDVGPGFAKAED